MQSCALNMNSPQAKTPTSISSLAFDPGVEVVWSGSQNGKVTGLAHPTYERIVRYSASTSPILNVIPSRHVVTSVSSTDISVHSRGGVLKSRWSLEECKKIECSAKLQNNSIVVSGEGKELFVVDITSKKITNRIPTMEGSRVLAKGHKVFFCGKDAGKVEIIDNTTLKPVGKPCNAHVGRVLDIASKGNYFVTCGELGADAGLRNGKPALDIFVRVFDIRTMRQLRPVNIRSGAIGCVFLPRFSSSVLLLAPNGRLTTFDANLGSVEYSSYNIQVQTMSRMSTFEVSPTGEMLAFGDEAGIFSVMVDRENARVTPFARPADPLPSPPIDYIPIDDENLPFCSNTILPPKRIEEETKAKFRGHGGWRGRPTSRASAPLCRWNIPIGTSSLYPLAPVDPSLVPEYRSLDALGSAPYPQGFRRNCTQSLAKFTATSSSTDKFRRSAASHRSFMQRSKRYRDRIPKSYARVKIKIPRFGLHTFDFSSYNSTNYSGLLNLLPNSYVVELCQVLYHIKPIRAYILNHLCMKELCITCELGFLFHMMDECKGATAEPRNLLRTLRQVKEASALGFVEGTESSLDTRLSVRIQGFCRFLLSHLSKEIARPGAVDVIRDCFEFRWQRRRQCIEGKHVDSGEELAMTVKLEYPRVRKKATFESLLESGLNSEKTQRVWCETCKTYRITKQSKTLRISPFLLTVNADINSETDLDLWRTPASAKAPKEKEHKEEEKDKKEENESIKEDTELEHWVPSKIRLGYDSKKERCLVERDTDDKVKSNLASYKLVAIISHVSDPPDTDSELNVYNAEHLTAHVAIKDSKGRDKWVLFNGFVISDSVLEDAIQFAKYSWKEPCILFYQRVSMEKKIAVPTRMNPIASLGLAAFLNPLSLSACAVLHRPRISPLRMNERVGPSMHVAIDCEFVAVEREETRVNPRTGKKTLVKPMRHSLARISLIRASGPDIGKCLLDDYIVGSEPVVDYLTRYSGIQPGDLDRSVSQHHLVSLKSAYLRLRYLADRGVTFIGHGLKSDFMLINIVVPKNQIFDTVDIYHIPGRRKLSLKFLAMHVLKLDIQGITHDSIEDARTAMMLYHRYRDLKQQGIFERALAHLYDIGDKHGFKT